MTIKEWKELFHKADKEVKVDWDADHCYSYISGIIPDIDLITDERDRDEAENYLGDWLYYQDNEPPMYCCPTPVSDDDDEITSSCGCCEHVKGDDALDYVNGYIKLCKAMGYSPEPRLIQFQMILSAKKIIKS